MLGTVFKGAVEVETKLASLGFELSELFEVVHAAVNGKRSCTANDPVSAPGWMAWREGSRRLREVALVKPEMRRVNLDNVPWVYNDRARARFTVTNTAEGTGIVSRLPQPTSRKGAATDRAVASNQSTFFEETYGFPSPSDLEHPNPAFSNSTTTWYLCIFVDDTEVRAELSCPSGMVAGAFDGFYERIILIGPGEYPLLVSKKDGPDPSIEQEYEVPVSRKK